MNLSERIANWLTAGRYQTYKDDSARADKVLGLFYQAKNRCDVLSKDLDTAAKHLDGFIELVKAQDARLKEIAACETPKSNGTVRRMARIARGEK